jgi:SpoVK/Ycf46/Vps4 family AAA+-type ATPase
VDRAAILRICSRRVPLASDVDIDEFASRLEGSTGADIESLCKKATLLAIAKHADCAQGAAFVVRRDDFESVLDFHRGNPAALKDGNARSGEFALAARLHLDNKKEDRT